MIGVAALFLMPLNSRIMGMSGILSGLLVKLPDWPWRLAFVIGVMVGPFIFMAVTGAQIERQTVLVGPLVYVAAFLVGLGTAVGLYIEVMAFAVCHGFHCGLLWSLWRLWSAS